MSRGAPEAALRAPVARFLEGRGFRVWADPDGRDFLDVVAANGPEVGLVELKVADWKGVRVQAVARRALADWVAVALPSEGAIDRLAASLRGPVAPRIGLWLVRHDEVEERRAPRALDPPPDGSEAAEARRAFRALVRAALDGVVPPEVRWGGGARRTGRGTRYRLEEFGGRDAATAPEPSPPGSG